MAFKEVQSLDADTTVSLGGFNKKTRKENPTQAEGYYLGSRQVASKLSKTGFAKLHVLQTESGNIGVWGKTDLDRKMTRVPVGAMIRVTQSGSRPSDKGNDMYLYRVEVDESNTIEVAQEQNSTQLEGDQGLEEDYSQGDGQDDELAASDEVSPTRPVAPTRAAAAPDAARQAKVKELLAKGNRRTV